jgi:phage tail sheath gpL-like
MSLQIPITGLGADYLTPGAYAEILYAQGPASVAAGTRQVVLAMPMLSTGLWTAGQLYPIGNEKAASDGAGPGSMLHRAARIFLQANKDAKLYALPVTATTGGSPVAATATVTVATTATGQGTAIVTLCGEDCSFSFKSGDTVTTIAAGLKASINSKTWLPVTADNIAGVLTITAKLLGASQGTASLGVIRLRASYTAGVGTTVTTSGAFVGTGVAGVDGSTTEAAQLATALATIDAVRKYYIVTSAIDATSLSNLASHISNKSAPRQGLRSVGIAAYPGTLANAITLATARNYERLRIVWQANPDADCAEMAANYAAILQKRESADFAFNFNGYRQVDWLIPPTYFAADRPDGDDMSDAIAGGLTPIGSDDSGSYIVKSNCTRSKNSAGTVNDQRATESKQVSVTDAFVDEELANWALNHAGKKLMDDEFLADGTINSNQRLIRNVLRPSMLIGDIKKRMDDYELAGQLDGVAETKATIRAVKTGGRIEVGFDLLVISWANILTERVAEVSTG